MTRYESIIWDWNGTLLDDVGLAVRVMNRMLAEHDCAGMDLDHHRRIFDFPVSGYYERAGLDLSEHQFQALSGRFCAEFEQELHLAELFPDARSTVVALSDHRHFVLSNTEQATLHRMLAAYELASSFERVHGLPNRSAAGKVEIGERLLSAAELDPSRTVLVGDTTHDAAVADALGVDCLLVSNGHNSHDRLAGTGYPVVTSLTDVMLHLRA